MLNIYIHVSRELRHKKQYVADKWEDGLPDSVTVATLIILPYYNDLLRHTTSILTQVFQTSYTHTSKETDMNSLATE